MNTRELNKEKKQKEQKEIDAYEANLKLHYDSLRNELDTIIRWSIPLQMGTIKTVMWLNIVLMGLGVQIMIKESHEFVWIIFLLLLISCISIGIALKAMIIGRKTHYGNHLKRTYMMSIPDDKWSKVEGVYRMFYDISRAVRYNGIVLIKRKKSIRIAMLLSGLSLFLFIALVFTYSIKGNNNDKETPRTTCSKPIWRENNDTTKAKTGSASTATKEINLSIVIDKNLTKGK